MSFDLIATLVLVAVLSILVIKNRKKLTFQRFLGVMYVAMYRTKAGLKTMDKLANKIKPLLIKGAPFIIAIGFIGMAIVSFDLIRSLINLIIGASAPSVGVVLPVKAKGVFYVPFAYWIISIFAVLVVHEGAHGVMARALGMKVKNSGLVVLGALVPLIPGAFVEPDEKVLAKAKPKHQLAVFAAGPFSNIFFGFVFLMLLSSVFNPIADQLYDNKVVITDMMGENSPAELAGLHPGESILAIDGTSISSTEEFSDAIRSKHPGETLSVLTSAAAYDITLGENPKTKTPLFGVYVEQPLKDTSPLANSFIWVKDLLFWLFVLNLGVGLFNLIPLGPIDGGRMLLTTLQCFSKKKASVIWKSVSVGLLCVLVTNVVVAFF
ncbi:site-2 protease family protein [Candidatus Woesearchaeota archaeon]|nr:site-2 protease family protein [Candidatus Woesearchaeota archaeon]